MSHLFSSEVRLLRLTPNSELWLMEMALTPSEPDEISHMEETMAELGYS